MNHLLRLVELTLSSRFRLLLASYRWLLVMLSLANLLLDAGLSAVSLKSTQCAIQRLVLFYDNI